MSGSAKKRNSEQENAGRSTKKLKKSEPAIHAKDVEVEVEAKIKKKEWDPELFASLPADTLRKQVLDILPDANISKLVLDYYVHEDEEGTLFVGLLQRAIPNVFFAYPWTLHGRIGWHHWTARFIEWCKRHQSALCHLEINKCDHDHAFASWYPALILFFVGRNAERHYGSYEAQILIQSHLIDWHGMKRDKLPKIEALAKKMEQDAHLPALRYIYTGDIHTIIAQGQINYYMLRYHHLLNEAESDASSLRRFFKETEAEQEAE